MIAAFVLLGLVGACAGLAFLSEESVWSLRAKAFEAKRWVLLKLDSLGQAPGANSDDDLDLEAGFGGAREALVDNGKRVAKVQQQQQQLPKSIRPVRRSVHGAQGSAGTSISARVSTGPRTEFAPHELHENGNGQQQHQQRQLRQHLPTPLLATAMSSSGRSPNDLGKVPPHPTIHRRGMSYDVNATAAVARRAQHEHHHPTQETSSARGGFVTADFVAAFAAPPEGQMGGIGGRDGEGGGIEVGGGGAGGGTVERQIPEYVPPQKKGALSKATHRRTSSRGVDVGTGVGSGVGAGAGGVNAGAAALAGSIGRSTSPVELSQFSFVRSPAKALPPVPAFGAAGDGGDPTIPSHPPPFWSESSQDLGGGRAGAGGSFYGDSLPGSIGQLGESGLVVSPVPFAPDDRQIAGVSTPKRGLQQQQRLQQQQDASSGRRSLFIAGPSPDGGPDAENPYSQPECVANASNSVAYGGGQQAPGGSYWNNDDGGSDAYGKQRDERAPISVLPASPAWSVDDDVNRGTGVRRRLSPRAGSSGFTGGGGGGGARDGSRSPRRTGAGWTQLLSPGRRTPGARTKELRPRALAFPLEASSAEAGAAMMVVIPNGNTRGLRIDVGAAEAEQESRDVAAAAAAAAANAVTPAAGGGRRLGAFPRSPMGGRARASPLPNRYGSADSGNNGEAAVVQAAQAAETVVAESTVRQEMGLRRSAPIYDRGRNMLGSAGGVGAREGAPKLPPMERPEGGSTKGERGGCACGGSPGGISKEARSVADQQASAGREVTAAVSFVPAAGAVEKPTLRRVAEEPTASANGAGQPQGFFGEHARPGRDLSSKEAFSASLDLPFDQLDLLELIGGGGFGQVYRGVWRGTTVAIKVLAPDAQKDLDEELAADFQAEVLMLAALRHPNVCLFMGACMVPPNRAIVTELLTRGSLWEALREDLIPEEVAPSASSGSQHGCGGFRRDGELPRFVTPPGCWPWSVIVKVAEGVACGMWYLHQHEPFPILHRDLKSANLLLDECFNVKICDFGLARLKAFTNSAAMTGNCGTVQWMAPEVLASEKYAEPADVYSFAIVCWELLSRACPYDGMSQIQVAVAVLNDARRPSVPDWSPREFTSLIESCWEQDPAKRLSFGGALEILRENHSNLKA